MSAMFFIVGTGRCGTQMLRNLLNCWPDVVILPETHFIISLYDKYRLQDISAHEFLEVVDNVQGTSGKKWVQVILNSSSQPYEGYQNNFLEYVQVNKVEGGVRVFTEAFYNFLYGKGKEFGDKTPHYGANLKIIKEIWPEARIIHLIRDGVDCALSMLGHPGFIRYINENVVPKDLDRVMYRRPPCEFSAGTPNLEQAVAFWDNVIRETLSELEAVPQEDVLEVKYEDLVFQPEEEITKIANFLEIDNERKALKESITIPRPFPEKHAVKKLKDDEYVRHFNAIKDTMVKFGYPYNVNINRGLFETFQELYRGRFNYLLSLKNNCKKIIKILIGKA